MKISVFPTYSYFVLLLLMCLFLTAPVLADDESYQSVEIADPFIELHTGPGSAYPIFHVVDRGASVQILKRRTDWFKVRTDRGKEGWVSREQMQQTLNPDGTKVELASFTREEFEQRDWETGVMAGEFGGASVISPYVGYHFTNNLSIEVSLSQVLGNFSDSTIAAVHIVNQPFPNWLYSPFMTLGSGVIRTEPNATLIATQDRTDQILNVGFGIRRHLSKRFLIRAEYKKYVAVTTRNENDDVKEWKLGLSVFF